MKNSTKIMLVFAAAVVAATAVYIAKQGRIKRMLAQVADEGYETAHDILFPNKGAGGNLRYGPVIPS